MHNSLWGNSRALPFWAACQITAFPFNHSAMQACRIALILYVPADKMGVHCDCRHKVTLTCSSFWVFYSHGSIIHYPWLRSLFMEYTTPQNNLHSPFDARLYTGVITITWWYNFIYWWMHSNLHLWISIGIIQSSQRYIMSLNIIYTLRIIHSYYILYMVQNCKNVCCSLLTFLSVYTKYLKLTPLTWLVTQSWLKMSDSGFLLCQTVASDEVTTFSRSHRRSYFELSGCFSPEIHGIICQDTWRVHEPRLADIFKWRHQLP